MPGSLALTMVATEVKESVSTPCLTFIITFAHSLSFSH